jgi:hypothetical protein
MMVVVHGGGDDSGGGDGEWRGWLMTNIIYTVYYC